MSSNGIIWTEYCANCSQATITFIATQVLPTDPKALCSVKLTYSSGYEVVHNFYFDSKL